MAVIEIDIIRYQFSRVRSQTLKSTLHHC